MFLIDSSAWVEYFRPGGSRKVKERITQVLQKEEAVSCGIVIVEVLRGARRQAEFDLLQESLMALPQIGLDGLVIERAAEWGFRLDRKGKVVSTTDLLIAAAAFGNAGVLHLDHDFEIIASECDLQQEKLPV